VKLGLASMTGSPGVTTLATLFAGLWPTERVILIEADTDTVCLGPRFSNELKPEPSIVDLAAECRHGVDPESVLRQTQRLSLGRGFDVIVGGQTPVYSERALSDLAPQLEDLASVVGFDLIVDLGRVLASPAGRIAAGHMDGLVVCIEPRFEAVEPLLRRLSEFSTLGTSCVVVGIGKTDDSLMAELDAELRTRSSGEIVYGGTIAQDAKAASAWNGRTRMSPRALRASSLVRSANSVLAHLTASRIEEVEVELS